MYDVKIADFGLSKSVSGESFARTHVGTPYYWAPEVIQASEYQLSLRRGGNNNQSNKSAEPDSLGEYATISANPAVYDYRADLWSLGVVLYVTLMGHYPFNSKRKTPLAHQIMKGLDFETLRKSKNCSHCSDNALDLISRLLVPNPSGRFSIAECAQHQWMKDKTEGLPYAMPSIFNGGRNDLALSQQNKGLKENVVGVDQSGGNGSGLEANSPSPQKFGVNGWESKENKERSVRELTPGAAIIRNIGAESASQATIPRPMSAGTPSGHSVLQGSVHNPNQIDQSVLLAGPGGGTGSLQPSPVHGPSQSFATVQQGVQHQPSVTEITAPFATRSNHPGQHWEWPQQQNQTTPNAGQDDST